MKYFILLIALLSASSLFGADQVQTVDTKVIQLTNAELQRAIAEANLAKKEATFAQIEAMQAKAALAREKADREDEAVKIAEAAEAQAQAEAEAQAEADAEAQDVLKENSTMYISVVGQGVAPMNTTSPAQAYALAKRAAIADAYRAIAEKVKGVRIDGQDLIKNMMVKRSTIRTSVKAMVRNANVVETTFKEGLCEVEMEIVISHSDFPQ
ncbi:MAG: hypothetical protein L3J19_01680 [Sulfurimonas sp.]|nr:hypothetical protein [Sulfurimonas sp.]